MKKWLWGVLTGMALMSLLIVAASVVGYYMQQRPPSVSPNTYLTLDISGELPEQSPQNISGQLLGSGGPATFIALLRNLEKAGTDSRITGVLLKPAGIRAGWAKLEELRAAIEHLRQQNKKVIAVLGVAGAREYFLATAADEVVLAPTGFLDLKGMRAEVSFFKDMLGKLGIQADLEHIGAYKNFSDQFTENRMTDAFREATTSMLDAVYGSFIETTAAARDRSADEMRNQIEQEGPFDADRALELGLVDELSYEDEVWKGIEKENPEQKPNKMEMKTYARVPRSDVGLDGGDRIALVYAVGSITKGKDSFDPIFSGKTLGSDSLTEILDDVSKDDSIKGVLVRIDSPGGDAFASDDIWRAMMLLREKKPVVISMSDLAASGGYYMAATGDPIVAQPGTLTGSIGIIYGKLNLKGLYDKIGIQKEIIRRGPYSAMDSDYGSYTPAERERVRALMDNFYQDFVGKVAEARKMTPEDVDKIAQGRVWTGAQAKENGLVDELGGLNTALGVLKKNVGLSPDAKIDLVEFPRRKSLIEMLVERLEEQNVRASIEAWTGIAMPWKQIERIFPGPVWARMPYVIEFE